MRIPGPSLVLRAARGRRPLAVAPVLLLAAFALSLSPGAARAATRLLVSAPLAADLADEDARRDAAGEPWRYALPNAVHATCAQDGVWSRQDDGTRTWRLELAAPGALSLNLGFTTYWLPRGATLALVSPAAGAGPIVFDDGDNADHGQLWTPAVAGDALTLVLTVPADTAVEPLLELGWINSGYRGFGRTPTAGDKSGACNVDVACAQGDAWRDEIAAVGLLSINGSLTCTGALVNNTAADGKPYLLTAYHCGLTAITAPTLVVYWNYQSPTCGQHGGGSLAQFTSGSTLLATWSGSDFTLVQLDESPDPAFDVRYAGWYRGPSLPTAAVTIHHPSSDEKSISFENDPLQRTSYLGTSEPGDGSHLRIVDWDTGTTEPGSSGSPLFDQDHRIVGQLHGGWAACGNNESDWYGWLYRSWDGGGTAETRLADWLDPGETGALAAPLLDPNAGSFTVAPAAADTARGRAGGAFTPASWTFTLTADGARAAPFTATVDAGWLTVDVAEGEVPGGGSTPVTVSLSAAAAALPAGTHTAILTLANPGRSTSETRQVVLVAGSDEPVLASVGPNPFRSYVTCRLELAAAGALVWQVHDLRGGLVRGPETVSGAAGTNEIVWNGRDQRGRRVASGSYTLTVQVPGRTFRIGVTAGR